MTTLKELIAANAKEYGQDYAAIAAALNAPTVVANPDAGKVTATVAPAPVTLKMVMAAAPVAEMTQVYERLPAFSADLKTAIDASDRDYMAWLLALAMELQDADGKAIISAETAQKLGALLAATVTTETTAPDTLPGPSLAAAAGLGVITPQMVQAALN